MDTATLHRRTVDYWRRALAAVGADDWHRPTPCADWDVHALVNHVVGEELWTVPLVDGATIEQVGDRFDGDVLGDDPAGRAEEAASAATDAVDRKAPQGGKVQLSYGEEDLDEYVRQLSADHLVHGWDLAVTVGADTAMDPDLVRAVAAWFAEREEMYRSYGIIGPRQQGGGDAQSEMLAAFGRDSGWSPA